MFSRIFLLIICTCILLSTPGCATIGYYYQSVQGQLELVSKRVPIDTVLENESVRVEYRDKLKKVNEIRDFAISELGLPDNNSYRYYVDLNRDYVVWNVFAAPELSLEGKTWCFLVIGCLGYRGYFSREDAENFAAGLSLQGYDVFVGGVTAYSTLGWFADPVLSTMVRQDENYLLKVIFHELAHQQIHFRDDTRFNEAFAETVAIEGTRRWHKLHGTETTLASFDQSLLQEEQFITLILDYRNRLEDVYGSSMNQVWKRSRKKDLLDELGAEYRILRSSWENNNNYDNWFAKDINNAKLLAVSTYRQLVPAFRVLLHSSGNDLPKFYTMVEKLRHCSPEQRETILMSGINKFSC